MVVADEAKIQQEPNACYRWSRQGQTPIISVKRDQKKHLSIYGGLSWNTGKVFTHYCDWQNGAETIKFLDVIRHYWNRQAAIDRKQILLVWDNVSYHKSQLIKDWLAANPGVVELYNFPPYHPELNRQENVWRALKRFLADLERDEQAMWPTITDKTKQFLKNKRFSYQFV